ncbi:hypothetical protein C1645_188645 [Glomus cerebriforme]|uniref:PHD-type domain-containing protein n=1 Tax=Glomus cerebriforme TaxID=658196 RepID=A0A397SYB2_9GLOM|nr:hypothetical protein C1645_188645 [Glomus cerebriforme]
MTSQPTLQVTNSNTKATPTSSSKQQASNNKGNPQLQEEWGDEDGEFELEEDDITQTEQSMGEKQESSESIENNAEDDQEDDQDEDTFSNQQQSSINYNSSHKTGDNKSPNKQASSSSSPLSQHADVQENDNSPKTKYGRKVQKPVLFTPETKKSQSDIKKKSLSSKTSGKRQRRLSNVSHNVASQNSQQNTLPSVSSPNMEVTIKIEQESDQVVADDIVCILCHDGNSPKHNRIVLCDKCDTPYHQRCHKPFIEDRVVEIPDAEWMCSKCDDIRGNKRRKVEIGGSDSSSRSYSSEISGDGLTEDQKIAYLSSLPQRVLIDLILIAEKLHPDLPLYPADVKEKIANNAYSSDRGNDSRALATSTVLSHQSFMSQMTIPLQPPQNYSSSSVNNNLSRAHLPAVGIDLPSYEEMIVQALASIADPAGSAPRNIFDWMNSFPSFTKSREERSRV